MSIKRTKRIWIGVFPYRPADYMRDDAEDVEYEDITETKKDIK